MRDAGTTDDGVPTRVDAWLWSIRICSTRSEATAACRGGHVKINGTAAKAAQPLKVGDRVACYVHERPRDLEVVQLIRTRVGAPAAVGCYIDHSPPYERNDPALGGPVSSSAGRPTKRDRRHLNRLRGR